MKPLEVIRSKIVEPEKLALIIEKHRKAGRNIVFTNGCFDILHRGHIEYLSDASELGDVFVIGLNSDDSVRRIKGKNRPALDEKSRAMTLAAFEFVDYVTRFAEDTPSGLIRMLAPDVWVKGGDYTNIEALPEYRIVVENGGRVIVLPFVKGYSTTNILNRIRGNGL